MNIPVKSEAASIIESVIVKGDLSKLTPDERVKFYIETCNSVGLNPLTKPFEYITLNNKLTLYALRNCTDQLRTIHGVSVDELTETEHDGVFIVTAKVRNRDGRTDIAKGAVSIANLKGEVLANAMMKAETKAKRRATLSLCGLGFLDESEVADVPVTHRRPPPPAPNAMTGVTVSQDKTMQINHETGEIGFTDQFVETTIRKEVSSQAPNNAAAEQAAPPTSDDPTGGAALSLEDMARQAALKGEATFKLFYASRSKAEKDQLKAIGDELRGLMHEAGGP